MKLGEIGGVFHAASDDADLAHGASSSEGVGEAEASTGVGERETGETEPKSSLEAVEAALRADKEDDDLEKPAAPVVDEPERLADPAPLQATDKRQLGAQDQLPVTPQAQQSAFTGEIPAGLNKRARERFTSMVSEHNQALSHYQALSNQHKELNTTHSALVDLLNDTNSSNEGLALTFDYLRLRNSADPAEVRMALDLVDAERAELARALGVEVEGVDLLEGHEDLRRRVEDADIAREDALQIANARRLEREAPRRVQQMQQERDEIATRNAHQEAIRAAIGQLDALDAHLRRDINYAAKLELLGPATVQEIMQLYAPQHWPAAFKARWDVVSRAMERVATPPVRRRDQQPLMGTGGVGGEMIGEPKTIEEAITRALRAGRGT